MWSWSPTTNWPGSTSSRCCLRTQRRRASTRCHRCARIDSGPISALKFGDASPRVVFLHGGGQNAHTWDTVIVGLGEPALAVDLPGHGRSAWRDDGDYGPKQNAATLTPVLRELAPNPALVVGMSLGGLTAIRLAASAPDLVPQLVLVDVTPSAPRTAHPDDRRAEGHGRAGSG